MFCIILLLMRYEDIELLLASGRLPEALAMIEVALAHEGDDARMLFLKGRAMMKVSRWGDAISCFLKAETLDPNGPARESRMMLNDILDFYNKDMYNQ